MNEPTTEPENPFSELISELQKLTVADLATKKEKRRLKENLKMVQEFAEGVRNGGITTKQGDPTKVKVLEGLEKVVSVLEDISEQLTKQGVPKAYQPRPEKGPDAFSKLDGLGRFSNSHFVGDHIGAQLQKDAWEKNTQGEKVLRKEYPNGGVSTALIRPLDETDAMNAQLQQQVLERFGPFTADVTLAVIATMCDPRNKEFPLKAPVLVTTDRILEYKKFQQRGERREEMERRVEQAMQDIQRLCLDFDRVKVDSRKAVTLRNDRLFYASEVIREQQLVDGTWIVIEKGWRVTPGNWQFEFMNPTQRLWFSHGARGIMELSNSDKRPVDQLAKLLWMNLLICPTGTWHLNEPRVVDIEPLLQRIGVLPEPDSRDKNWYRDLRDNFDTALDKLAQMGVLFEWHYLPGCPPLLDATPGAALLWLASQLSFTDPAAVAAAEREHLPDHAKKRAALADQAREVRAARKSKGYRRKRKAKEQAQLPIPEPTGTLSAAELKQWRNERGIQQAEMARRLGVTQQYFSYMERGKRAITAELTKKLQAMMDSP